MNAPLSMHVAMTFGVIGVVLVFIGDHFPRKMPPPRDWDPYAWRLWQDRHWPAEPLSHEYHRAVIALGYTAFDRTRDLLRHTNARWRWRTRRAERGLRTLMRAAAARYPAPTGLRK